MAKIKYYVCRAIGIDFIKYTLASAFALLVDYGFYLTIAKNNLMTLPKAAVIGYAVGLIVAYFLISSHVFRDGWLRKKKYLETFLFLVSGLLGMALTYISVKVATMYFGQRLNLAKIVAVGVSFVGVYIFRKMLIFKKSFK